MVDSLMPGYYVAPNGNDLWSGALAAPNAAGTDGPFATLEHARNAMRAHDIDTTYVRDGLYRLPRTLELDGNDHGVTFAAYPGETPVISGGKPVTGFHSEGDGLFATTLSEPTGLDLLIGGERQRVAQSAPRDPDNPFTSGWSVLDAPEDGPSDTAFVWRTGDVAAELTAQSGLMVQTFDTERLNDAISDVTAIDHATRTVTFDQPNQYPLRRGGTYRLLNDESLIRDAGDFAWRAEDGSLVVKPANPDSLLQEGAVVPRLGTLVHLARAQDITLSGLTFRDTRYDGDAVSVDGGSGNAIGGNHFIDVGTAVALTGADRTLVGGNLMEHLADTGIRLSDGADGNRLYDNSIADIGEVRKGGGAIVAGGSSGTLVEHNDITNAARYGISFKEWDDGQLNNDNRISHNRITHIGLETADAAGIEILGRSGRDTNSLIEGNFVEDTGGLATHHDSGAWIVGQKGWGIMLDDLASGVTVRDNYVAGSTWANFYLHGGDHNIVENNIGVVQRPQDAFVRVEWVPRAAAGAKPEDNRVERNLAVTATPDVHYWALLTTGRLTMGHNVTTGDEGYNGTDTVVGDPGFIDADAGNHQLAPDSPALAAGIHDLDWSAMGTGGYVPSTSMPDFWRRSDEPPA